MKMTLMTSEINEIVNNIKEQAASLPGKNVKPYLQFDFSKYTLDTLEAIKEALVAEGIGFEDRWNNGSDFVIPVKIETAPSNLGTGRRDVFTKSDGPICEPGQAKKPLNLGRRDAFTRSDGPICEPGQAKKPANLGRRDTFTKSDGPICEPGQAKKPASLGRRDTFTRSDGPVCDPGQAKKPANLGRRDGGTRGGYFADVDELIADANSRSGGNCRASGKNEVEMGYKA